MSALEDAELGGVDILRGQRATAAYCGVHDGNPAYWDEQWATRSRFGGLIAPPQMLSVVCRVPSTTVGTGSEWEPGYIRDRGQSYYPALVPGDRVLGSTVTAVSPEKRTRAGRGVFVETVTEYTRDRDAAPVGRVTNCVLSYNREDAAKTSSDGTAAPHRGSGDRERRRDAPPRQSAVRDRTRHSNGPADDVEIGDALSGIAMDLTFMDLVRAANGIRRPVLAHTDREYARAAGRPDADFSTRASTCGRAAASRASRRTFHGRSAWTRR